MSLRFGCLLLALAGSAFPQAKLDINRLYRLPWVIGSAPKSFVWSADSKRLAFLWNDEGTNFYDIWVADRNTGKPVRVTRMPRPEMPLDPGTDIQKLQQVGRAETDGGVSQVTWAPDQQSLLFLFQHQLYAVRPGEEPRLLVTDGKVSAVKAAPTGDHVAFVSGVDLFVTSMRSRESPPRNLTNIHRPQVSVEDFYWSHDAETLAFIESDESRMPVRGIPDYLGEETTMRLVRRPFPGEPSEMRRLGLVSLQKAKPVRWADLGGNSMDLIFGVAWSPDSKTLLVDRSDLYIKDRRLLLVDAATGRSSLLRRETDAKNVTAEWWADWAPDGKRVYFISDCDNDYHLYSVERNGGKLERLTQGNWAVFSAVISSAAQSLFYTSNEGRSEERHLYRLKFGEREPMRVTQLPGTHADTVSPDGTMAADYFSNDLTPPDLYLQKLESSEPAVRVTKSPLPEFNNYHWAAARYVSFPSTADGVTLHARITLPPDFDQTKKYPAILGSVYSNTVHNQWGGRVAHPTWGLDQYLAQQGYVLLNVDIRGSSGYGKAFRQRLGLNYGGIDVEDLYSGVKYLEAQGYVDMKRVGLWGSSYGGLLTTTSLFSKPGVYQAGVAGAPATSLFHALTGEMRTMMAPQDHAQEYTNSSAFLKSGGLTGHLMLIHGMRDEVVLFKDSVTLEERLILQGKDVRLVVLPDAPHGWDTGAMAQTRYAYQQLIDFFKTWLGDGPS